MALTNAEKQARWRAKRDAEIERLRNQPDASAELAEARKEIERLRNELKAAQRGRPRPLPATFEELLAQGRAFKEAEKAKRAARTTKAAEKYAAEDEPTLQLKLMETERQLAAAKTRIKTLSRKVRYHEETRPPKMTKWLHRQVLASLHPDRAHGDESQRKKLEKCFQEFGNIKFTFPPDDN